MKLVPEKFSLLLLTIIAAFCGDIFCYFLFDRPYFSFLLVLLVIALARQISWFRISLFLFLLSVESFFFYGRASLNLIYLIPITIAGAKTRDRFWDPAAFTVVFLIGSLLAQTIIVEYYLLDISFVSSFTFLRLFINIILTIFLSML